MRIYTINRELIDDLVRINMLMIDRINFVSSSSKPLFSIYCWLMYSAVITAIIESSGK